MTYINKSKFNDLYSLYDFFIDKMKILDINILPLDIKRVNKINDIFFLIDPSIDELKLLLDLDKEVVIMFTYVPEDFLLLIKSNQVKKVIIFDSLDELFLKKRGFNNFELVSPFTVNQTNLLEEKINSCVCYDELSTITDDDINIITSVPGYNFKTIYSGYKIIKKKRDFHRLKAITDSDVLLKNFPLFNPLRELEMILYTLSFTKQGFPIVPAITANNSGVPLIFSQRYYSWILSELQSPNKDFMSNLRKPNFTSKIQEKQFNVFHKAFSSKPTIKDVLSEYN